MARTTLDNSMSRRTALKQGAAGLIAAGTMNAATASPSLAEPDPSAKLQPRPWVTIRGIYGGFPGAILERGTTPADFGINAIWVGSGGLKQDEIDRYRQMGLKIFAEFNSLHSAM